MGAVVVLTIVSTLAAFLLFPSPLPGLCWACIGMTAAAALAGIYALTHVLG